MKFLPCIAIVLSLVVASEADAGESTPVFNFGTTAASGFDTYTYTFTVNELRIETEPEMYWAYQMSFTGTGGFYMGLQPRGTLPDGTRGKMALFSFFGSGVTSSFPACSSGADGGAGGSCHIAYDWQLGVAYQFTAKLTAVDNVAQTETWTGTVTNTQTGVAATIGVVTTPLNWGLIKPGNISWYEWFNGNPLCSFRNYFQARYDAPIGYLNGVAYPTRYTGDNDHASCSQFYKLSDTSALMWQGEPASASDSVFQWSNNSGCLTLNPASGQIQTAACDLTNPRQLFRTHSAVGRNYTFLTQNSGSDTLCMEVSGSSTAIGGAVAASSGFCGWGANDRFVLQPQGGTASAFLNVNSGLCVSANASGATQQTCSGADAAQVFTPQLVERAVQANSLQTLRNGNGCLTLAPNGQLATSACAPTNPGQQFALQATGALTYLVKSGNLCVDTSTASAVAAVGCSASSPQIFALAPQGDGSWTLLNNGNCLNAASTGTTLSACSAGNAAQTFLPRPANYRAQDGRVVRVSNGYGCLTVNPGNYANAYSASCNSGSSYQKFTLQQSSGGQFFLTQTVNGQLLCLDVYAHAANAGATVGVYPCNYGTNESFTLQPLAYGWRLNNVNSQLCLSTTASGSTQQGCVETSTSQTFALSPIESPVLSGATVTLRNGNGCLTQSQTSGTAMTAAACAAGNPSQQFVLVQFPKTGNYVLQSVANTGQCAVPQSGGITLAACDTSSPYTSAQRLWLAPEAGGTYRLMTTDPLCLTASPNGSGAATCNENDPAQTFTVAVVSALVQDGATVRLQTNAGCLSILSSWDYVISPCSSTDATQKFTLNSMAGNVYYLQTSSFGNLCADDYYKSPLAGNRVAGYGCGFPDYGASMQQQWLLHSQPDGSWILQNALSDWCMSPDTGGTVQNLCSSASYPAQRFTIASF